MTTPLGTSDTHPQGIALEGSHRKCDGKRRVAEKRDSIIGNQGNREPGSMMRLLAPAEPWPPHLGAGAESGH